MRTISRKYLSEKAVAIFTFYIEASEFVSFHLFFVKKKSTKI